MGGKSRVDAGKPQRAVGYVRVSTQEQVASGAGLDVQRAVINAEVERRGWVLRQVFSDEGVSGKSLKRPGLSEAVDLLRAGEVDVLVVSKLDRLSRSVIDFAGLLEQATKQGWVIVVLDIGVDMTTPHGRFIAHVMSASAQWERELIGQRTKEALAIKAAQGIAVGRPHSVPPETVRRIDQLRTGGIYLPGDSSGSQ